MPSKILPALAVLLAAFSATAAPLDEAVTRASRLERLHALLVAHEGETVVERVFRGPRTDVPVNIKSVSKSVIAALVGAAIDRGVLKGVEQKVAPLLGNWMPADPDPRLRRITVGHLLAMQAGLEPTSGPNYGRWVTSRDWVRFALARPFVAEPGGPMLYSTGSYHLLSAVLTRASGRSTYDLARDWLAEPLDITIPAWQRGPEGVYLGGNNMALSPRALLRFGEMYRQGGTIDGKRVLSEAWVRASWTPQGRSPWTGHDYGYGWAIAEERGQAVYYARGYGGQMLYVVPGLRLTAVLISDGESPSRSGGYFDDLHRLVVDAIMPSLEPVARAAGQRIAPREAGG